MRPLLLAALLLAGSTDEQPLNRFGDPFEVLSADISACPEPRGPRMTAAEARVQAHHRAERGTSCWLAGQCSEPSAYRFDAGIAAAARERLRAVSVLHPSSLWMTVQGRIVYLEGCVERPGQAAQLETVARGLPDVLQAVALVRVGSGGAVPYRRME